MQGISAQKTCAEKRPSSGGWEAGWDRPFQPPATRKQAANGQPNYRNSVDRSELVWSTSVGGLLHFMKSVLVGNGSTPLGMTWLWQRSALTKN